jgi:gas vesicle protein
MGMRVCGLMMALALALLSAGCDEGAQDGKTLDSKDVEQAVSQADQGLKDIAKEAEASSEAVNKHLPSIMESIKKILGIVDKEAKQVQQELDKLPKQQPQQ